MDQKAENKAGRSHLMTKVDKYLPRRWEYTKSGTGKAGKMPFKWPVFNEIVLTRAFFTEDQVLQFHISTDILDLQLIRRSRLTACML